jgi:hypothetical protein
VYNATSDFEVAAADVAAGDVTIGVGVAVPIDFVSFLQAMRLQQMIHVNNALVFIRID